VTCPEDIAVTVNGTPVPFHRGLRSDGVRMLVLDCHPLVGGDVVRVCGPQGGSEWVRFPFRTWLSWLTNGHLRIPVEIPRR
jgi:hypothetical protein